MENTIELMTKYKETLLEKEREQVMEIQSLRQKIEELLQQMKVKDIELKDKKEMEMEMDGLKELVSQRNVLE